MATPDAEFEEEDDAELEASVAAHGNNGVAKTAPAAVPGVAAPRKVKRKLGRRGRVGGNRMPPPTERGGVGADRVGFGEAGGENVPSAAFAATDDASPSAVNNKDIGEIWNRVVAQHIPLGYPPDAFYMTCKRHGYSIEKNTDPRAVTTMANINGEYVAGAEGIETPGEALVRYITDVYHMPIAQTGARYVIQIHYKSGTANVKAPLGELTLQAPAAIERQRAAHGAFMRGRQELPAWSPPGPQGRRGGFGSGQGGAPAPMWPPQQPWQGAQQPQMPLPPPPPVAPPPPGASPEMMAQWIEAERYRGAYEQMVRQQGMAPPPVAGPTAEQTAAQTARVIAQTLAGIGFTPELVKKLSEPAATPALSTAAATAVADPVKGMESFFSTFEVFERFRTKLYGLGGAGPKEEAEEPDEPPPPDDTEFKEVAVMSALGTPVKYGKRKEGEGLVEYAVRWASSNPDFAEKILSTVAAQANGPVVAKIVERFMQNSNPKVAEAGRAAAAETRRGFVDAGEIPINPPERGWTPSV